MKKSLLLLSILFVSVITTACINNFAVQELNNKAKAYMEQGDYQAAIERLKSSIDLDDTIFESYYNLAVAYTQAEDYANAMETYKKALELNPDVADVYYSLAVAEGNLAVDLKNGTVRLDEEGRIYTPTEDEEEEDYTPSEAVEAMILDLNADAVKNYEIYIEKSPASPDVNDVRQKINDLQNSEE